MFFLKNTNNKVIFGWSGKCGCGHVKKIFKYFITNNIHTQIHVADENNDIGEYDEDYEIILFIRNPFERLISGFLDKYSPTGQHIDYWNHNNTIPLTFNNFVNELITSRYINIDYPHFTPQLSQAWNDTIKNHKKLKIYDINNIDYSYIEQIFNKKIPNELITFKGGNENKKPFLDLDKINNIEIYNLLQTDYIDYRPVTKSFFNKDLEEKVYTFYKKDFDFFSSIGFTFTITSG